MKLESALAGSEIVGSFRSVGSAVALAGSFGLVCCANSDLRMRFQTEGAVALTGSFGLVCCANSGARMTESKRAERCSV